MQRDLAAALAEIHGVAALPPQPTRRRWLAALALTGVPGSAFAAQRWTAPRGTPSCSCCGVPGRRRAVGERRNAGAGRSARARLDSSRPLHVYVPTKTPAATCMCCSVARPRPDQPNAREQPRSPARQQRWPRIVLGNLRQRAARGISRAVGAPNPATRRQRRGGARCRARRRPRARQAPGGVTLHGTHLNALLEELAPDLRDADRARIQAYRFNDSGGATP